MRAWGPYGLRHTSSTLWLLRESSHRLNANEDGGCVPKNAIYKDRQLARLGRDSSSETLAAEPESRSAGAQGFGAGGGNGLTAKGQEDPLGNRSKIGFWMPNSVTSIRVIELLTQNKSHQWYVNDASIKS